MKRLYISWYAIEWQLFGECNEAFFEWLSYENTISCQLVLANRCELHNPTKPHHFATASTIIAMIFTHRWYEFLWVRTALQQWINRTGRRCSHNEDWESKPFLPLFRFMSKLLRNVIQLAQCDLTCTGVKHAPLSYMGTFCTLDVRWTDSPCVALKSLNRYALVRSRRREARSYRISTQFRNNAGNGRVLGTCLENILSKRYHFNRIRWLGRGYRPVFRSSLEVKDEWWLINDAAVRNVKVHSELSYCVCLTFLWLRFERYLNQFNEERIWQQTLNTEDHGVIFSPIRMFETSLFEQSDNIPCVSYYSTLFFSFLTSAGLLPVLVVYSLATHYTHKGSNQWGFLCRLKLNDF